MRRGRGRGVGGWGGGTVNETALNVNSGRKIPCRTGNRTRVGIAPGFSISPTLSYKLNCSALCTMKHQPHKPGSMSTLLTVGGKITRQCSQTTTVEEKGQPERN